MMDSQFQFEKEEYVLPKDFAKINNLELLWADETQKICFKSALVNRPGLVFAGFDDYFASQRVQVIGNAEFAYLNSLEENTLLERIENFGKKGIPCVIVCRGIETPKSVLEIAQKCKCPIFASNQPTSHVVSKLTRYLDELLAKSTNIHGVLLDISGVGVLISGKSGIGKSETALELVHRGHMLVADDVVQVKKIKGALIGRANEKIKNLLEVRGVGIINVEDIYGIGAVLDEKMIDFVVEFVPWTNEVDRLGNANLTENILDVEIPKIVVPVTAGRNLAIVIEAATKNLRLKRVGRDASDLLLKRMEAELAKKSK